MVIMVSGTTVLVAFLLALTTRMLSLGFMAHLALGNALDLYELTYPQCLLNYCDLILINLSTYVNFLNFKSTITCLG